MPSFHQYQYFICIIRSSPPSPKHDHQGVKEPSEKVGHECLAVVQPSFHLQPFLSEDGQSWFFVQGEKLFVRKNNIGSSIQQKLGKVLLLVQKILFYIQTFLLSKILRNLSCIWMCKILHTMILTKNKISIDRMKGLNSNHSSFFFFWTLQQNEQFSAPNDVKEKQNEKAW